MFDVRDAGRSKIRSGYEARSRTRPLKIAREDSTLARKKSAEKRRRNRAEALVASGRTRGEGGGVHVT